MNKVRFYTKKDFELSGYKNILVEKIEDIDLSQIDDGELDELILDDVIDFMPIDKVEDLIKALSIKIKKQGNIIFTGRDLYEVSKEFSKYDISIVEANKGIFGDNPNFPRRLGFTVSTLSNFLKEECKLKILKKRVNKYEYCVEATR